MPDTDIKIVDLETGTRDLPSGEAGELCICGPQVMKGYWNRPDETARVLRTHADGRVWLHTGDIATIDEDGYTTIVQRKKDMIIVDGFNVYPSEVEAVLLCSTPPCNWPPSSACRTATRRSRARVHRAEAADATRHRGRTDRALPEEPCAVQGAAPGRHPARRCR